MGQRSDLPLPVDPYRLTVVLVGTSHAGNLGAVCRGMLNHGFDRLRLVNPQCDIDDEARNRAKHAGRILTMRKSLPRLTKPSPTRRWLSGPQGSVNSGEKRCFVTSCTLGSR